MANNGSKNSNDSQFFITLGELHRECYAVCGLQLSFLLPDRADELNGKHTLFGRVIGDTFFSK